MKVPVTPATAVLLPFVTVATSGLAKAVLIIAVCGVPPVAVIEAGGGPKLRVTWTVCPATPPFAQTRLLLCKRLESVRKY